MTVNIKGIFFQYLGGKTFLIKHLLPLIPPHKVYVEVFGGSAELLFRKEPSEIEVYNDVDGELVNLFEVVRNRFDEFKAKAKWLLYSRELNKLWSKERGDDPVERAIRTWYVYQTSFAGQRDAHWAYGKTRNVPKTFFNKMNYTLEKIHNRLENVYIENLDFRSLIPRWDAPETFFFMDPPYRNVEQANKIAFIDKDYEDLANVCHQIKGKFLITLNDDDFIRKLFEGFIIDKVECVLASRRITRVSKIKSKGRYSHLLIRNYEVV